MISVNALALGGIQEPEFHEASAITMTYSAVVKGASGASKSAKLIQLRRSLDELVKVGTITKQRAADEYKKQSAQLAGGTKLEIVVSSNGRSLLYKEMVDGKLQDVTLFGRDTRAYASQVKRLEIVRGTESSGCGHWPYVPVNLAPLKLFGESQVPEGHSIEELQPLGPRDSAVGVHLFGVRLERPDSLAPAVATWDASKNLATLHLEAGRFVRYGDYRPVGEAKVPGHIEQTLYDVTPALGKRPAYNLSPAPVAEIVFTLKEATAKALPPKDYEIESYLPADATVDAGDVMVKFKPEGKGVDAQITAERNRRPPAPKSASGSLAGPAVAAGIGLVLISGGIGLRMRSRRKE